MNEINENDKNIAYGLLKGWLTAFSVINCKTNHQCYYNLFRHEKNKTLKVVVNDKFKDVSDELTLLEITEPKTFLTEKLTENWFYDFLPNTKYKSTHFTDKHNDFIISDKDDQLQWIEEFVNSLLYITDNPKIIYELKIGKTKKFYALGFFEIFLESDENIYHLHFEFYD